MHNISGLQTLKKIKFFKMEYKLNLYLYMQIGGVLIFTYI